MGYLGTEEKLPVFLLSCSGTGTESLWLTEVMTFLFQLSSQLADLSMLRGHHWVHAHPHPAPVSQARGGGVEVSAALQSLPSTASLWGWEGLELTFSDIALWRQQSPKSCDEEG